MSQSRKESFLLREPFGIAFIFFIGALWHYIFDWSGRRRSIAWLAPVNESTWEHFKMGFWPGLLLALIQRTCQKNPGPNFWQGKALGLASMPLIVAGMYHGFMAIFGKNLFLVNILIFLVAVVTGQNISYRVQGAVEMKRSTRHLAVGLLILVAAGFCIFSYRPLKIRLFEDPRSNRYGILGSDGT